MKHVLVFACALSASFLSSEVLAAFVSGEVRDQQGAPIENVVLGFRAELDGTELIATTDSSGFYTLELAEGAYDIDVAPPPESPFVPQLVPAETIPGDRVLDLVMVWADGVTHTISVSDANGMGLGLPPADPDDPPRSGEVRVNLHSTIGQPGASAFTNELGVAHLDVIAGEYSLDLSADANVSGAAVPDTFYLSRGPALHEEDTVEDLVVTATEITGQLTDGSGPIAGARVNAWQYSASVGTMPGFSGFASSFTTTDASGFFSLLVFEGQGQLELIPPAGSGVGGMFVPLDTSVATDYPIVLPATISHAITLVDGDGMGVGLPPADPGDPPRAGEVRVNLASTNGQPGAWAFADALGVAALNVVPGEYSLDVSSEANVSGAAVPDYFYLSRPPALIDESSAPEALMLAATLLTGQVTDGSAPVAGARVNAWQYSASVSTMPGFSGFASSFTTTDATGAFSLLVFDGQGQLEVIPAAGSGLGTVFVNLDTTSTTDYDVVLPETVSHTITLIDGSGVGVGLPPAAPNDPPRTGDVRVSLYSTSGSPGATGFTNQAGVVTLEVAPGEYYLDIGADSNASGAAVPNTFAVYGSPFLISSDSSQDLILGSEQVALRVLDVDGNPVAAAHVSATQSPASLDGLPSFGAFAQDTTSTDIAGEALVRLFQGPATLSVSPKSGSGLGAFGVPFDLPGADSVVLLLQFLSDSASALLAAGQTITTDDEGDGATPNDPVETTLTTPVGGEVTLNEAPITQDAPADWQFLTQQVNITAPDATTEAPMSIEFRFDASRLPEGIDESTLAVFRDGVEVPPCSGADGSAEPDPCVSARALLADGDVSITVLSSRGGAWNLGVSTLEDSDGDGVMDDVDECVDDAEDSDGFEDEDGCPDLDNDADGIADQHDECPNDAEDLDGHADMDGCADLDNDSDGIGDERDACPNDAEDLDGVEDQDGCPEAKGDHHKPCPRGSKKVWKWGHWGQGKWTCVAWPPHHPKPHHPKPHHPKPKRPKKPKHHHHHHR